MRIFKSYLEGETKSRRSKWMKQRGRVSWEYSQTKSTGPIGWQRSINRKVENIRAMIPAKEKQTDSAGPPPFCQASPPSLPHIH